MPSQFDAVTEIGLVLESILDENPDELFLIEGHTDAVGSDDANLLLSDRRAETMAVMLSSNFDIAPENLVTQGTGEQFLKVPTEAPERENRRVALRRITDLVRAGGGGSVRAPYTSNADRPEYPPAGTEGSHGVFLCYTARSYFAAGPSPIGEHGTGHGKARARRHAV